MARSRGRDRRTSVRSTQGRWPLRDERFVPFAAGRIPVRPWHVDWFSGKGVQSAWIDHPDGPLRVATVHMQADYDGVVENMRLADGSLWPIPITLATSDNHL